MVTVPIYVFIILEKQFFVFRESVEIAEYM